MKWRDTSEIPAEVLLRDGDWTVEKLRIAPDSPGFRSAWGKYYSLVKHVCYPDGGDTVHQVVVYPDDSTRCWRCTEPIPDGMIAVWKFQNWEQLRYGGG